MIVVLDTNVIVSAYLKPLGCFANILEAWHDGVFDVVVSEGILTEYHELLLRPDIQKRHQAPPEQIRETIEDIREISVLVQPTEPLAVVTTDPDDNKFLECAVAGGAEYVISSDPDLLSIQQYRGIQILSPSQFIELIKEEVPVV